MNILTTYHSAIHVGEPRLSIIADALMKPLVTACGKEYNVTTDLSTNTLSFMLDSKPSTISRIIAFVATLLLFPLVAVGLVLRNNSAKQRFHCSEQNRFLLSIIEHARNAKALEDVKKASLSIQTQSHDEVLSLKKQASRVYKNLPQNLEAKTLYRTIRNTYYTRFLMEHAEYNINKHGQVRELAKNGLWFPGTLSRDDLLDSWTELKSENAPSTHSWFHGTPSASLPGIMHDGCLKPAGVLRTGNNLLVSGEHDQGSFGISMSHVSGTDYKNVFTACVYSKGPMTGSENHDSSIYPQAYIEAIGSVLSTYLTHEPFELIKALNPPHDNIHFTNLVRNLKSSKALESAHFEDKIAPLLGQIIEKIETCNSPSTLEVKKGVKEILNFVVPSLSNQEKSFILNRFPVVMASKNIVSVDNIDQTDVSVLPPETKLARRHGSSMGECSVLGNLRLGSDISMMYVPNVKILELREYLSTKNINGVSVRAFETLTFAMSLGKFSDLKLKKAI